MITLMKNSGEKVNPKALKLPAYDHSKIEPKWQKLWEKQKFDQAREDPKKKKFYGLIEFPYPSGEGLHVGHIRSNTAMDIITRKRRREGYEVLFPIGWDAFGLPTENYAIKTGIQPAIVTKKNTDTFRRQLKALGFSFDWSREIDTTDPKYYKWTQWIFLQFFKKGLAYKKKMAINWCPKDMIGLANEEVVNGCCERCGTPVEKREKEQWMLAITKYADRLDRDLDEVDFLEKIKIQQRNWIGKSEGAEIGFKFVIPALDGSRGHAPTGIQDHIANFVLLHGFTATPDDDFHPWLKKKLENLGYKVQAPKLPNTEKPTENEQVEFVLDNVKFDENTVLLGHSLGSVVALKVLEKLNKKIAGLVTVGGFIDTNFKDHDRNFAERFGWDFDFNKIKLNVSFIRVLHDKNDVAITDGQAKRLATALGVNVIERMANEGHFCAKEEPAIFEVIIPSIKVFTTRPDTLFGVTYLVLAPEHQLVKELLPNVQNKKEVEDYISKTKKETDIERADASKEKTGVELKGIKVINPANNEELPVWIADYVLVDYGTGAVMAVPAHDERDKQFAQKYSLPTKEIILADKKEIITEFGKSVTTYKLRDWVFSRQRYWGEPIPVVHCEQCGIVPVPEKDLPVKLPKVKNYQPTQTGESPLASIGKWVNTKCPKCKGKARRETDTMPQWAGSSWYYLRYADSKNSKVFAGKDRLKYWTPVDWYNGGMEHTTLHLLYSRFWHKFLFDLGLVPTKEPYQKRTSHGLILAEGGAKMSKSRDNIVSPDDIVKIVGADSLRLYEMFMGPFDQPIVWNTDNIAGVRRFIERVWKMREKVVQKMDEKIDDFVLINKIIHKAIKKVSDDIEAMRFNTAISALMITFNELEKFRVVDIEQYGVFLKLLAPFAPHVTEELWASLNHKNSIHTTEWPMYDPVLAIDSQTTIVVQINGKMRGSFTVPIDISKEELENRARTLPESAKWLEGKSIMKIVVVPNKLVNFVIK